MQVIEKNSLFAQVSGEQSAVVSGGNPFVGSWAFVTFLANDGLLSYPEAVASIILTSPYFVSTVVG
ncbi:hypothetical protein FHK94_10795 [Cylindrospermopsis raciborskii CS-506_D]|uniref:Uncharacterized protein n=1 Tax=Cylindrospermopsis raciborskii CS-506_A TaxID=2585140 RepID=A0A838WH79_9CYAN|nr:hypothetical protein [Cylindrospermopsis raciborskii]MBA4445850.1 hypothetical protein [Cylindrospermopsis raciborskii CS-506_C]MBA4450087.1 hypothetical protein [Cylindrospermopsis raciborskii CS-506_D]MBA4456698.1 hypothetical protein [Cylindrospermopsis raciborskii CS-506_B]MBA4466058.1 hypothetical protein [Cylindrospermopsis raciborskii CS-506_A]